MRFEELLGAQSSHIKIKSNLQDKIMQGSRLGYGRCLTGNREPTLNLSFEHHCQSRGGKRDHECVHVLD